MITNAFATIVESAQTAAANLHQDERGQGMTEYVIILVAIAVVCIAIAVSFGGKIKGPLRDGWTPRSTTSTRTSSPHEYPARPVGFGRRGALRSRCHIGLHPLVTMAQGPKVIASRRGGCP